MQTAYSFRKAFAANSTGTTFVAKVPTTTKPSGDGVFDLFSAVVGIGAEVYVPEYLQLVPFGSDADNETLDLRLWGWSKTNDAAPIWIPQLLAQLAVTFGNIAATALGTDNFLADTIAVTDGADEESGFGASLISTVLDTASSVLVGLRGCELIEFDMDIGTAAGGNCLWRALQNKR